ncbi:hypothetical protein [Clostridium algidicarnis]|uniref:hypothetical protein n=1 Tax=Clostridium algidicarnis TaxID=37659 RepID=UPI001C0C2901|nr:hypothetical protein [Clostridium algidicarnis]MBU3193450.1 hypothetical protein [Clostridium algidicarnis]MBU3203145.1 hypothetical protein [Clostridium algidicarnis]MBU3211299.1 hypothetical protein [Clostridium algidicarnis]MBU3222193.1 hypothetical protein [Clostridium algidicarnis]
MNFITKIISPSELILDENNPRFIVPPNSNEEDIIKYLLQYEQIIELIQGININKGLLVGERIIIFKKNNKYIVAEGNRRTCACKLMLNKELIPSEYRKTFPEISSETIKNIYKIPVDIVKDKNEALNSMGTKHISGVREWSSYSKMQFFALQFNNNNSTKDLSLLTSVPESKIIEYIKSFKLISYAKSLNIWSSTEINDLFDFHVDKATIFPRALNIKSNILDNSVSKILEIQYDEDTLLPSSKAPKELFNYCIYQLVKHSYDEKDKFNTRSKIDEITEVIEALKEYKKTGKVSKEIQIISENKEDAIINSSIYKEKNTINSSPNNDVTDINEKDKKIVKKQPLDNIEGKNNAKIISNNKSDINKIKRPKPQKYKRPISPKFFSTLTWSTVNAKDSENSGLIDLCNEIVNISKSNDYKKYPISATILARSLFEQTLVYHLKKINKYDKLLGGNNGRVPPLDKIISYYKKNLVNIFEDKDIQRTFLIIADSEGNKHYFDMVIHNPQLVKANPDNLDALAEFAFRGFIDSVLNL